MKRQLRVVFLALFGMVLMVGFQNCGPAPVTFNDMYSTATGLQKCSAILKETTAPLRILFMFDNSTSTLNTDSNNFRATILENFLAQYGDKANFSYAFGWFAKYAYFWDPAASPSDFKSDFSVSLFDSAELSNAVMRFRSSGAKSGTFYTNAFAALNLAIEQGGPVTDGSSYAVVFMSDGMPTDLDDNKVIRHDKIITLVNDLKAKAAQYNAPLTISSVFFGGAERINPVENLQLMAQVGGGQFVNTNDLPPGRSLDIADLITVVSGENCAP